MNKDNKGRPGYKTLDGWGTDLDTRRLQVTDPAVAPLTATVTTLNATLTTIEEENVITKLGRNYAASMSNERYISDRRGYGDLTVNERYTSNRRG